MRLLQRLLLADIIPSAVDDFIFFAKASFKSGILETSNQFTRPRDSPSKDLGARSSYM